jgi:hypothetical protein
LRLRRKGTVLVVTGRSGGKRQELGEEVGEGVIAF